MYVKLILLICRFYSCRFAYLLKFIYNPQINACGAFVVICRHAQNGLKKKKKRFVAQCAHSQMRSDKATALPFCFSSHTVNKHPFHSLLTPCFLTSVLFCW